MIINKEMIEKVYDHWMSVATFTNTMPTKEELFKYFATVNHINGLPLMASRTKANEIDSNIGNYVIVKEFKDLIYPSKVGVAESFEYRDFVDRGRFESEGLISEIEDFVPLTSTEFRIITEKFYAAMKNEKDGTRTGVTISREFGNVTADKLKYVKDGRILQSSGGLFIPLEVDYHEHSDTMYSVKADDHFHLYLMNVIYNVKKYDGAPGQNIEVDEVPKQ